MELKLTLLAGIAAAVIAAGCSGGSTAPTASAGLPKDPYVGMSTDQKIKAIQDDPTITTMQKQTMIADLKKQQGQ